jgi:hypothetical protein
MPRAAECDYNGRRIEVEEALRIRKATEKDRDRDKPVFRCVECGKRVRAHKGSEYGEAHFEHFERNPKCSLSDRAR